MNYHRSEHLNDMLSRLSTKPRNSGQDNTVEQVRAAMRQETSDALQSAFDGAMQDMPERPNFASGRFLFAGLYGLLNDIIYSLWDTAEDVAKSDYVQGQINATLGKTGDLAYKITAASSKGSRAQIERDAQKLRDGLSVFKMMNDYVLAVADYCRSTGKSASEVIDSPAELSPLITQAYGSVEKYIELERQSIDTIASYGEQIAQAENLPIGVIVAAYLRASDFPSAELGINTAKIGSVIDSYAKDFTRFGKVFMEKYAIVQAEKLLRLKQA